MLAERALDAMAGTAEAERKVMKWGDYDPGVDVATRIVAWAPAVESIMEGLNAKLGDMMLAAKKAEGKDEEEEKKKAAQEEKMKEEVKEMREEMKKKADDVTTKMMKEVDEKMKETTKKIEEMTKTGAGISEMAERTKELADNASWYADQSADSMRLIQAMLGRLVAQEAAEEEELKQAAEDAKSKGEEREESIEEKRAKGRPDPIAGTWARNGNEEEERHHDGEKGSYGGKGPAYGGKGGGDWKEPRVDVKGASHFWPSTFLGEKGAKVFATHRRYMEVYLTTLAPEADAKGILDWLGRMAGSPGPITEKEVEEETKDEETKELWMKISKAAGPMLHKRTEGAAGRKIRPVSVGDGFNTWRVLAREFSATSPNDGSTLLNMINQGGA